MSMKPENKFRRWFVEQFAEYMKAKSPFATFRARKHADYANAGVLDMDFIINGTTVWIEFKLLPEIKKRRKLDVTELQRAEVYGLTKVGAASGVLIGLPLGPRKGYEVAYFTETVPTDIDRTDFGPVKVTMDILYSQAYVYCNRSLDRFQLIGVGQ